MYNYSIFFYTEVYMRLKYLCKKCGSNDYKSLTSLLSFKYGSTIMMPCFKCNYCSEKYIVTSTQINIIIEQLICILTSLFISFFFFKKYPPEVGTQLDKLGHLRAILLSLPLYGISITLWNYLKSFLGVIPLSYTLIQIDEQYNAVQCQSLTPDYIVKATKLAKHIKNLKEHTVYRIRINKELRAVQLLDYDITENDLKLIMKNVNVDFKVFDDSEVIIYDSKNKEICRGYINKIKKE